MQLSKFQKDIIEQSQHNIKALKHKDTNKVINISIKASAGSGKSFLLGKIFEIAYEQGISLDEIRVLSFVRNLKDELTRTFKGYVVPEDRKAIEKTVRTFNSIGLELMESSYHQWNKLNPTNQCSLRNARDTTKYSRIVQGLIDSTNWNIFLCSKSQIVKVIDHLREQYIVQPSIEDTKDILSRFNVKHNIINEDELVKLHSMVAKAIIEGIRSANPYYTNNPCADYTDHCLLPILLGQSANPNRDMVDHFKYALDDFKAKLKLLLVDEVQDSNPVFIRMIEAFNHDDNCVVTVGDDEQNIYVWRGAETDGMTKLCKSINAQAFSLPISYRLPRNHVQMIKSIWTDKQILHHHEQDGQLILLDMLKNDGEYYLNELDTYLSDQTLTKLIVGRKNSSIFKLGLKLVSRGHLVKLSTIASDAKGYAKQVLGHYKSSDTINFPEEPELLIDMIDSWAERQRNYLLKREAPAAEVEQVSDWASALAAICFSSDNLPQSWDEWEDRIDQLNSRKKNAIKLSTIHAAKGAEAELVIFTDPDACPMGWRNQSKVEHIQEMNALFVALSRTKLSDKDGSGTLILLTDNPVYSLNGWMNQYANAATNLELEF